MNQHTQKLLSIVAVLVMSIAVFVLVGSTERRDDTAISTQANSEWDGFAFATATPTRSLRGTDGEGWWDGVATPITSVPTMPEISLMPAPVVSAGTSTALALTGTITPSATRTPFWTPAPNQTSTPEK